MKFLGILQRANVGRTGDNLVLLAFRAFLKTELAKYLDNAGIEYMVNGVFRVMHESDCVSFLVMVEDTDQNEVIIKLYDPTLAIIRKG